MRAGRAADRQGNRHHERSVSGRVKGNDLAAGIRPCDRRAERATWRGDGAGIRIGTVQRYGRTIVERHRSRNDQGDEQPGSNEESFCHWFPHWNDMTENGPPSVPLPTKRLLPKLRISPPLPLRVAVVLYARTSCDITAMAVLPPGPHVL